MKVTKVTIIQDGPALLNSTEDILLELPGQEGVYQGNKIAICRCGKSANKITCDGSHKKKEEVE